MTVHYPYMPLAQRASQSDRKIRPLRSPVILISGQEKMVSPVSVVSINLGIWFYEVEIGDTGESIEPEESRKDAGFR